MKKVLILIVMLAISFPSTFAYFSDVNESTEFSTYINWLKDQGVVQGYADGTFGVYKNINRAEFLKMLYETTFLIDSASFPTKNPFKDVPANEWYYKYVMQAYADGVVQGYGDGTFRPANNITLAEAMKIVQEAFFGDNIGFLAGEGCSKVDVFYSCGSAIEGAGALTGCKRITDEDWSFIYFCLDKSFNIHGEAMLIQADLPISRGLMAQLIYRTKAINDNNFVPYTEDISPKGIIFTYTDPEKNFTLKFPISWENMISERQEYLGDTNISDYYAYGFGFEEQENMIQIVVYTKAQWNALLAEDGLTPEFLGEKNGLIFGFYHAKDCVSPEMCLLMESTEKIKNSFSLIKKITLQAK